MVGIYGSRGGKRTRGKRAAVAACWLCLIAVAFLTCLAGCGGGDEPAPPADTPAAPPAAAPSATPAAAPATPPADSQSSAPPAPSGSSSPAACVEQPCPGRFSRGHSLRSGIYPATTQRGRARPAAYPGDERCHRLCRYAGRPRRREHLGTRRSASRQTRAKSATYRCGCLLGEARGKRRGRPVVVGDLEDAQST